MHTEDGHHEKIQHTTYGNRFPREESLEKFSIEECAKQMQSGDEAKVGNRASIDGK